MTKKYWVTTHESYDLWQEEKGGADETAPTVTTDESCDLWQEGDGVSVFHRDDDARDSWRDALDNSIARMYWFNLYPVFVDASIQVEVLKEINKIPDCYLLPQWLAMCPLAENLDMQSKVKLARRFLLMLEELHRKGYQRLRIAPVMETPADLNWSCIIVPDVYTSSKNGAMLYDIESTVIAGGDAVRFTTADSGALFDLRESVLPTPTKLAQLFLRKFEKLAYMGKGSDWAYAGWYQEMIQLTAPANLPVVFSEVRNEDEKTQLMSTWGEHLGIVIPLPPLSSGFV